MKKLVIFLILATVFIVSCHSPKKAENNDADILPDEDEINDEESVEPDEDENDEEAGELNDTDKDAIENMNPCDPNPCENDKNSTGKCAPLSFDSYSCGCNRDYFWDGKKCYSPCDPNPCENDKNSTGECAPLSIYSHNDSHKCGCNEGYFWDGENCIQSPCDPNPCAGRENSTGVCHSISEHEYSCGCNKDFYWSKEVEMCLEGLPQCSPENNGLCKDYESGLIWSSLSEDGAISENPESDPFLLSFTQAENYCDNLKEGGYADWHLPTIDELRTLVINCPGLETDGACKIRESCLFFPLCYEEKNCLCQGESDDSVFSKFGCEKGAYWSSSKEFGIYDGRSRNVFISMTGNAEVGDLEPNEIYFALARCVRK